MATIYSHSRLSSFETCPRQFYYRYVERRAVDTEGIEAFVGKRVHAVLERLNQFLERGLVPPLAKVVGRYRAEWEAHFDPERIRIVRSENPPEAYRENGERCLANHYRRHYPFDRDETLGIEAHVAFPLDPTGRYRIQGFVDRIARAPDGAIEIHDYKTGRWVPSQKQLDADRQLALYQIGVQARYGADTSVRLIWHYLLRDEVRASTRSPEQLDALRARTIELIDRIESEQAFAPRPGTLCTWCEHNDICPAMQARRAVSAASEPLTASAEAATQSHAQGGRPASGAAEGRGARSPQASEASAQRGEAERSSSGRKPSEAHRDACEARQVRRSGGLEGRCSDAPASHRAPSDAPANHQAPSPEPAPPRQLSLL